VEQENKGLD